MSTYNGVKFSIYNAANEAASSRLVSKAVSFISTLVEHLFTGKFALAFIGFVALTALLIAGYKHFFKDYRKTTATTVSS